MRVRTGLGPGQHGMTPKKSVLDILDDSDSKDEISHNLSNGSHNLSSDRVENGHSTKYVFLYFPAGAY